MSQKTVTKIGKYDVIEILGKGGMGVVYKAMDNLIERIVAIKMMTGGFAENPDLLKRFYREAKSTGMLQHPNIVIVYDLVDHEGNPYLVMEFLDGEPLEQINAQVVDGRTDIFSCGVMLYELLTGVVPFDGKDTASTLLKIIHEPPPPLKNYLQNFPPDLENVIHKALAKDREERFATAEDFAFDLGRVQEQLKRQMVSDYVARAKTSIEKADLAKDKEILQVVLKVDTQHAVAKELMEEVQQRLQRQVLGEQIKQLRANAEEAFSQRSFQDALAY